MVSKGGRYQRENEMLFDVRISSRFGANTKTDKLIEKKDKEKLEAQHTRSRNVFGGTKLLVLKSENKKL